VVVRDIAETVKTCLRWRVYGRYRNRIGPDREVEIGRAFVIVGKSDVAVAAAVERRKSRLLVMVCEFWLLGWNPS
jgi:hypothetical protein